MRGPHGQFQVRQKFRQLTCQFLAAACLAILRHQVGQQRSGIDRRQLVLVAQQDQARPGSRRLEQLCHQGQADHRHLVDDDHVGRQRVLGVMPEGAALG